MKIEKNKIVFGSVLALIVIFIITYTMLVFGKNDEPAEIKQTLIPELEQENEDFKSRFDAVNSLKEVRETTPPSIYNERYLDSLGYYDPDLLTREKANKVDSIITSRYSYSQPSYYDEYMEEEYATPDTTETFISEKNSLPVSAKELGLEHQLFYSSEPLKNQSNSELPAPGGEILVEVDGNQVVQAGHRLRMRIKEDAVINGLHITKNTPVYGFVTFQPNRALIEIGNIEHYPIKLKAIDLQDGSEGIYVENNIRSDLSREVIDDIIQDINVAGVPQVGGVKKIFQRNNRNIKVTITNHYKLILKAIQ